jgi:hypothetical protein
LPTATCISPIPVLAIIIRLRRQHLTVDATDIGDCEQIATRIEQTAGASAAEGAQA